MNTVTDENGEPDPVPAGWSGEAEAAGEPRQLAAKEAAPAAATDAPDPQAPSEPALAAATDAPDPQGSSEPGLAAERDRLARELRDTRLRLAMTQSRLAAIEQSPTLELGRTLVQAARRPWRRGVQLPLDLIRLWRDRSSLSGPGPASPGLASAQLGDLAGSGERFLSALTAPGLGAPGAASAAYTPPGIVVTGVLTAQACATLGPDAAVHPLLPHDAEVMLESTGADVVLIEAAAMLPGSAWAYAVDPAAADRGRRLGRLIAAAQVLGKPVIFVRNVPGYLAPGLGWIAASCDAVSDDGFGVQLARFNPIGLPAYRPSDPIYAGSRDPREPPTVRGMLDSVADSVKVTGEIAWRQRPALYREHALFVSASVDQAREQFACGARVITVTGESALPEQITATSESALREHISSARTRPPLTEAEILPVLREIFAAHATPVRLAGLARLAGLPGHMVAGRQIAVLARVEDAAGATALSADLGRQRIVPAELVVTVGVRDGEDGEPTCRAVTAALGDLAELGVMIKALPEDPAAAEGPAAAGGPARAGWVPSAAKIARSPWVAPWRSGREYGESYLLDLACARECSQADAVGHAGAEYTYVTSLEPALARREFYGPDGSDHGLRLFSLS